MSSVHQGAASSSSRLDEKGHASMTGEWLSRPLDCFVGVGGSVSAGHCANPAGMPPGKVALALVAGDSSRVPMCLSVLHVHHVFDCLFLITPANSSRLQRQAVITVTHYVGACSIDA